MDQTEQAAYVENAQASANIRADFSRSLDHAVNHYTQLSINRKPLEEHATREWMRSYFIVGEEAASQANWSILAQHARIHAKRLMLARIEIVLKHALDRSLVRDELLIETDVNGLDDAVQEAAARVWVYGRMNPYVVFNPSLKNRMMVLKETSLHAGDPIANSEFIAEPSRRVISREGGKKITEHMLPDNTVILGCRSEGLIDSLTDEEFRQVVPGPLSSFRFYLEDEMSLSVSHLEGEPDHEEFMRRKSHYRCRVSEKLWFARELPWVLVVIK